MSAWPVLKCNQGSDVLEKGNLCTYQCFIDVRFISVSVLKEKLKNVPDWRWRDFVLNFAVCSADFHLRKRIHVLVKYYADCF